MTETEHAQFADALTNVHGLVCEDDGGDLCELMDQWTGVAAEYSRLLAAARAVVENSTMLSKTPPTTGSVLVQATDFDALRAAAGASAPAHQ